MTAAEKAGTVKYTPLTAEQKKLIDKSIAEPKCKESVTDNDNAMLNGPASEEAVLAFDVIVNVGFITPILFLFY